jgi:hypothetical protein
MTFSSEALEKFLERNQRTASSLRAVFLATHDTNYLREAAARFPNDPEVQLSVLLHNAFPDERRKWLEGFKENSPENSLANYLSARDYFHSGQLGAAVTELFEAARKPMFQDYTMESILALEELGRETGQSPLEARTTAMATWAAEHMHELAQLKDLTHGIVDLRKQYQELGDAQLVEDLSRLTVGLSHRLESGDQARLLINQLVGISIEALAVGQLPSEAPVDFLEGKTPKERTEELQQQSGTLKSLAKDFAALYSGLTESEQITYVERARQNGEFEAMRWLLQRKLPPQAGREDLR